jgi:hypothetical protein
MADFGITISDPFPVILALGPVGIYLLLLGLINLSRRPLLVSGGRDAAALALAVSGMLIVGPFELFLPEAAELRYGPYVWAMILTFYCLCVTMGILTLRPRLVIYNIPADKLRPILADIVARLDDGARWAGDSLVMPSLRVQLSVEPFPSMKNTSLKSVGGNQDLHGWRLLEQGLTTALSLEDFSRNPRGLVFCFFGFLILAGLCTLVAHDPQTINHAIFNLAETIWRMLGR